MQEHAQAFLRESPPFSFVPDDELNRLARLLTMEYHPRGEVLLVQGQSVFQHVYLVQQGALEVYDEEDGRETHRDLLDAGSHCGGVALLHNQGIALRNVRTAEDTFLYALPAADFVELASRYPEVREYCTELFSDRLLDRSRELLRRKRLEAMTHQQSLVYTATVDLMALATPVTCTADTPIREAARRMTRQRQDAVLVVDREDRCLGIVTDHDLRAKVIAEGLDPAQPVSEVMSSPVLTVQPRDLAANALSLMLEHHVKHLVVEGPDGGVRGVLTEQGLVTAQGHSPLQLLRRIRHTGLLADLSVVQPMLPRLVRTLSTEGAPVESLTQVITRITDAVLERAIALVEEELGPPPCRYAWLALGSEGRREQTLATDQDNALLYEDVTGQNRALAEEYFGKLADRVCRALNDAGYPFCPGGVMASNLQWRQPLAGWKRYFQGWIQEPEPMALMRASIFFDLRSGAGDAALVGELRDHLRQLLRQRADLFYYHLALNAAKSPPPLGFFRHFVVERHGDHRDAFNIKKPIMNMVDFTRVYALRHDVEATNTLERIRELERLDAVKSSDCQQLLQAYVWMMQLRFARQETAVLDEQAPADNFINPHRLTPLEQKMLREAFRLIERLQLKLKLDFTGHE